MSYRDEIIRMIQAISNEKFLEKIYYYVLLPFRLDKERGKE